MRSVGLIVFGLMLVVVALVPPGWQDGRYVRFLPGGGRGMTRLQRPRPGLGLVRLACLLAGAAFLIAGLHSSF